MLYIYHCGDFCEIISLVLFEALTTNGIQCQLSRDVKSHPHDLWLLFCYFHDLLILPTNYLVYQTEPMLKNYDPNSQYLRFLKGSRQIWEYSKANHSFYDNFHSNVLYIPFRYAKCLETWNQPKLKSLLSPSIDVCFIGYLTDYRKQILSDLQTQGLNVLILNSVFGREREAHLQKVKVHIILHNNSGYYQYPQDISRIFPFGAKRYFMVSEPIGECPIKSLIQCPVNQLGSVIKLYLQNDVYRQYNIEQVYNEVNQLPMSKIIKKVINQLIIM